jgi:hypothetical protein
MGLAPPSGLSWQIIAGAALALLIMPEAINFSCKRIGADDCALHVGGLNPGL